KAADEIGGTINAAVPAKDRIRRGQIIDKHHGAIAIGTSIEAERRALPEDLQITGVAGIHHTFAIAQAADEGTASLLAQHIAVRLAPAFGRGLDNFGQAAREGSEEPMAIGDNIVRGVFARASVRWTRIRQNHFRPENRNASG